MPKGVTELKMTVTMRYNGCKLFYMLAREIPFQDIAGPPIFFASHWGTAENCYEVLSLHESVADILSNGSRGGDFDFLQESPAVDFIVPNQAARVELETFIQHSSFEGDPPRIFVHKEKLRSDRFMDKADFFIDGNLDTSDLEMRWSEINRVSNREVIEEDWNSTDVPPEEYRRQFRLCYNYLLYMCMLTTTEDDERNSMENDVEEEDAAEAEPSGTQDTQSRYPRRDRKNRK